MKNELDMRATTWIHRRDASCYGHKRHRERKNALSFLESAKVGLMGATSLSKDALHVYIGLAVMLIAVAAFKRSMSDWLPLVVVAFVAIAGELWDIIDTINQGRDPRWSGNWKDIWNTMFWPFVLFCLARFTNVLKR